MSEYELLNKLEILYENRYIHSALVVVGRDSDIDTDKLQRIMHARNFPLGHSIFIVWDIDIACMSKDSFDAIIVKSHDLNVIESIARAWGDKPCTLMFT